MTSIRGRLQTIWEYIILHGKQNPEKDRFVYLKRQDLDPYVKQGLRNSEDECAAGKLPCYALKEEQAVLEYLYDLYRRNGDDR